MKTTRTAPVSCPECGYAMDAHTSANPNEPNATPSPGDYTVCIECAAILLFTPEMKMRTTTLRERNDAPLQVLSVVRAVTLVNASGRKSNRPPPGWQ